MARSNGLKVKVQTLCPDSGRLQREFAAANGSLAMAERCIKMSTNCKDKQPNYLCGEKYCFGKQADGRRSVISCENSQLVRRVQFAATIKHWKCSSIG